MFGLGHMKNPWGGNSGVTFMAPLTHNLNDSLGRSLATFARSSTATVPDQEGILRTEASGSPRFCGARRVENMCLQSQTLDSGTWTKTRASISADAVVAPDGTTTADTLVEDSTSSSTHEMMQSFSIADGVAYLQYIYAKPAGRDRFALQAVSSNTAGHVFDVSTGTAIGNSGVAPDAVGIEDAGGGWYLCYIRRTSKPGAGETWRIRLVDTGTNVSYNGDGVSGIHLWGGQLENVSGQTAQTPGEYQATTTAAVHSYYPSTLAGAAIPEVSVPATNGMRGTHVVEARTNLALYDKDVSAAAWVVSNVTKGSTSVETPDGSNSTTVRLTASAGNGTCLQTITSASDNYSYAVYMKRVTGTGDIDLTLDNGTTWTTMTLTSSWARFDIQDASETNPVFGARIVTSADAIDFWGSQIEKDAEFSSELIGTAGASATKAASFLEFGDDAVINDTEGSIRFDFTPYFSSTQANDCLLVNPKDQQIGPLYIVDDTTQKVAIGDGTNVSSLDPTFVPFTRHKLFARWSTSANEMQVVVDGVASTASPYDGAFARDSGKLYVMAGSAAHHANGIGSNLKIYSVDKGEAFGLADTA